jgi:hypothetical protein
MNQLPEELLDQIISCIDTHDIHAPLAVPDTTTLYALCRTSKKLYRIARPCLYKSVYMHRCLIRTLQADAAMPQRKERALRSRVRALSAFEEDRTTAQTREKLLLEILALAPNVEVLDLSRLVPSGDETPAWLALLRDTCEDYRQAPDWHVSTGFSSLTTLRVHLGSMPQCLLWPIFRLPNLVELELDVREQPQNRDHRHISRILTTRSSKIERLRIVGMKEEVHDFWHDAIGQHAATCKKLRSMFVAVQALGMMQRVVRYLEQDIHSGALTKLQFAGIPVDDPMFFGFELEGLHEGVDIEELFDGVRRMARAVIMGTADDCAGEERKYLKLVEVRKLSEMEKRAYDVKRVSRP